MKWLAALGVAVIAVTTLVAVNRDAPIQTESVDVEVPASPGDDETVTLDAALYFPASTPAPAIVLAHGFGSSRASLDEPAQAFAREGYVVLTYSARGFGRSGGVIGLNDPRREVADVTALVDLLANRAEVEQDGPDDPRVGIAGGSYGGGLSLLAATREPRLDAVVAAAAWHSLSRSLAPDATGRGPGVLKEQWASVLFTSAALGGFEAVSLGADAPGQPADADQAASQIDLQALLDTAGGLDEDGQALDLTDIDTQDIDIADIDLSLLTRLGPDDVDLAEQPELGALNRLACGRFSLEICVLYAQAATVGQLSPDAVGILDRASLEGRLGDVTAPTLLQSGLDDTLFDLRESADNAAELAATDVPLAVRWVSGGHGEASQVNTAAARDWFNTHLRSVGSPGPALQWTDAASGTPQDAAGLPSRTDGAVQELLTLLPDGTLAPDGAVAADQPSGTDGVTPAARPLLHPPGGVPAALSTLPGLGTVGGLLPGVDLPGQNAAFTTEPVADDLTLLGSPRLRVGITSVQPSASLFIKLYDVTPGGQSTLIHSAVNPVRLDGQEQTVAVELSPVAYRIVAGNRLRVTIATTDQGFATGRDPGLIVLAAGEDATIGLPVATTELASGLPTIVRIAIPVLLVLALGLAALWLTARHERRLAAAVEDTGDPPIMIRGLVKEFDDGKVAVDGLDLTVERGQVVGLLGPNGAGKTTTMRMLLGLSSPTAGEIRILGQLVTAGHPILSRVGVLVEGPGFAPYLTGMQNLESFWRAGGQPLEAADLDRALAVADLGEAIHKPTRTYSHGMRQRLAIAQALLGQPEILVLDEPTDGLDPEQIKAMRRLLAQLGEDGLTILVSSHLLGEVEQMCTHAAVVRAGTVVAAGPVSELVGAEDTLVITASDLAAAERVLHDLVGAPRVAREGEGLAVSLNGRPASEIIAALIEADVALSSAAPRGRLEDAFLELTRSPSVRAQS